MQIKWNEVTWYSKLAAVIFFIGVLPILTFCIGAQYEKAKSEYVIVSPQVEIIPVTQNSVTVSGTYSYNQLVGGLNLDFFVDKNTESEIPRDKNDLRIPWFRFVNRDEALSLLKIDKFKLIGNRCEIKGEATVEISKYLVYKGSSEGSDSAVLVKLIKASEPRYFNCAN